MVNPPKPTELAQVAEISVPYASQILGSTRTPSRPLAIHIFRKTGWRHPLIADLSDAQIATLEDIEPWRRSGDVVGSHTAPQACEPGDVHRAAGARAGAGRSDPEVLQGVDLSSVGDEDESARVIICAVCDEPFPDPRVRACGNLDCPHAAQIPDAA